MPLPALDAPRVVRIFLLPRMHSCKVHRRLPIPLLLDGLYANGPVMQRGRGYHWQFMIVLGDQALSTVWQEVRRPAFPETADSAAALGKAPTTLHLGQRLDYVFGSNGRQHLKLNDNLARACPKPRPKQSALRAGKGSPTDRRGEPTPSQQPPD